MPETTTNATPNTAVPVGDRLLDQSSRGGQPLPPTLLNSYRSQYGCDLPDVCLYPSHLATHVGGSGACRVGTDIYFAPEIAQGTPQWKSLLDQNMAEIAQLVRMGGAFPGHLAGVGDGSECRRCGPRPHGDERFHLHAARE